jgi:hypothetical protein
VKGVLSEKLALLDHRVKLVLPGRPAHLVPPVSPVQLGKPDLRDLRGQLAQPVQPGLQAQLGLKEKKATRAKKVNRDQAPP